jgi:hypothetical protein
MAKSNTVWNDNWGYLKFRWIILFGSVGLAVLVASIIAIVIPVSRAVGETNCSNLGEQTGYPTKFRILNFFDTGTCLVRNSNGLWVKDVNVLNMSIQK